MDYNGYDNIDEYYEDLLWDEIHDDPTDDYKYEMFCYFTDLAEDPDEYDTPF